MLMRPWVRVERAGRSQGHCQMRAVIRLRSNTGDSLQRLGGRETGDVTVYCARVCKDAIAGGSWWWCFMDLDFAKEEGKDARLFALD
jgi:hypothetical protein